MKVHFDLTKGVGALAEQATDGLFSLPIETITSEETRNLFFKAMVHASDISNSVLNEGLAPVGVPRGDGVPQPGRPGEGDGSGVCAVHGAPAEQQGGARLPPDRLWAVHRRAILDAAREAA